jgi:hypothetical protein
MHTERGENPVAVLQYLPDGRSASVLKSKFVA